MDLLFAKNKPFNTASIQQEDGGGKKQGFYLLLKKWTRTYEKECNNDEQGGG